MIRIDKKITSCGPFQPLCASVFSFYTHHMDTELETMGSVGPQTKKPRAGVAPKKGATSANVIIPPDEPREHSPKYAMRMQSSQALQFKALLDVLKDLLTEVNIRFDEKGIKIVSLDPGKIGMIHLTVYNFDRYECNSTFYCGVYMTYLYKIMRTVSTGHYVEWRITEETPRIMEVLVVNPEKRTQVTHRLKVLDLDIEEISIPQVDFDCVISMPSADFQKYVKELSHVANTMTIRAGGRNVHFISSGDLGESVIQVSPTPSGMNWLHNDHSSTFEGTYFIKYLERFSRGQVDPTVELFFRQNYPLVMRYQMTIGSLRFIVAPIMKPPREGE